VPAKYIAPSRLDIICFAKGHFARTPYLFRALNSKIETTLHRSWIFECLHLPIRLFWPFSLRTLLFSNSFSSRGCCSLLAACTLSLQNFCVENHQSLNYNVFRHEYPPQSTIGHGFSFAQPYLSHVPAGQWLGLPANLLLIVLLFCFLLLLSQVGQPFSRVASMDVRK
jgi:hypothetical protein